MRAFITGITGQDGSYLAELLLERGYEVFGLVQPGSLNPSSGDVRPLGQVQLFEANITDHAAIRELMCTLKPQEFYHLAAQTVVVEQDEFATMQTNVHGTHCVLAALAREAPASRFFFAGSSEMFGTADTWPQTEETSMRPRSLYGVSKVAGYTLLRYYRQEHGVFGCCGILYNHESPRRRRAFVTRKITRAVAAIRNGVQKELRLGNLDAIRDWGDARDYVVAMWQMLQHPKPNDYVIATGAPHTVRDLVDLAFSSAGLDWREYVVSDPQFYRPAEAVPLIGCFERARIELGWKPTRDLAATIREMVGKDLQDFTAD